MALEIKFSDYGDETVNGQWRKMCLAELWNGGELVARRVIQGIADEADRDAKAQAAFADFDDATPAQVADSPVSTTGWKVTISKAVKAVEPV